MASLASWKGLILDVARSSSFPVVLFWFFFPLEFYTFSHQYFLSLISELLTAVSQLFYLFLNVNIVNLLWFFPMHFLTAFSHNYPFSQNFEPSLHTAGLNQNLTFNHRQQNHYLHRFNILHKHKVQCKCGLYERYTSERMIIYMVLRHPSSILFQGYLT